MADNTEIKLKKSKTPFPHDHYIRTVMANPRAAKDFFAKSLPPEIRSKVNLDTLEPQKDSFVDDKLRLQVTDLLFAVDMEGDPGFLYLLCEHTSKPDRLLPFRIDRYVAAIQHQHMVQYGSKILPVVYPLVIYTGKKPYTYSLERFDLYGEHKELAQKVANSPCQLIDLSHLPDDVLEDFGWFRIAALLFKHVHDPDTEAALTMMIRVFREVFRELEIKGELNYIYSSLSYFCEVADIEVETFVEVVAHELEGIDKEKVMTLADRLREEGFKQGRVEGEARGRTEGAEEEALQIAKNMLANHLPLDMIERCTGIPAEALKLFMPKGIS